MLDDAFYWDRSVNEIGFLTYPVRICFLFLLKEDIAQGYARPEKTPSLTFAP